MVTRIRPQEVYSSPHLILSGEGRQEISRIRCSGSGLEFQEDVCFPSTSADSMNFTKIEGM